MCAECVVLRRSLYKKTVVSNKVGRDKIAIIRLSLDGGSVTINNSTLFNRVNVGDTLFLPLCDRKFGVSVVPRATDWSNVQLK